MPADRRRLGVTPPTEREEDALPEPPSHRLSHEVPAPGDVLAGKYQVERLLGQGGMGVVLAARHVELGQRVAVKFMLAEVARDAAAAERFIREARAAVALTSEHVARVLDVGRLETGAPYMVMEYLAGEDLARMLRRTGPLPIAATVGLVLQACDALAEAHGLGIVHRDLKPANLFVTTSRDGSPLVKVLDFGISKAATPAGGSAPQSLTASGMVMGSPGYMSPEQVRSSRDVDARSDVWSLGVILYELLTGVSPFLGESMGATFAKIVSENPRSLRELRPDVPTGLAKTIERCLERKLDARIDSVATLATRLAEFAPPESAALVGRIARIARVVPGSARVETLVAPDTEGSATRSGAFGRIETGPAWLRSVHGLPPRRPGRILVWAIPGALLALGAVLGAREIGSGSRGAQPGVASATASSVTTTEPPMASDVLPAPVPSATGVEQPASPLAATIPPKGPDRELDAGARTTRRSPTPPTARVLSSASPKLVSPSTPPTSAASSSSHALDVY